MKKVFIRLSFDGANFHGTQKQPKDITVQGVFEEALSMIYDCPIKTTISSRLDKGVHALDFGLTFEEPEEKVTLDHLRYALQRRIGNAVSIFDVRYVDENFSPRYDCQYKIYSYLIQNVEQKNPLYNHISYGPNHPLDEEKMKECLSLFVGKHDFRYLSTPEGDENTVLEIDNISCESKDGFFHIYFQAKAFLRYQIRFLVGAAIRYATGKVTLNTLEQMLEGKECKYQKLKAEPQGLTLMKTYYPELDEKTE